MKYFVVADVHGFYNEMMEALEGAGFDKANPEHKLISLGDATDRGPDAVKVIDYLTKLHDEGKAILIRGNHEDLMDEALDRGYFMSHDEHNGTIDTVRQITGAQSGDEALMGMYSNPMWKMYVMNCIDYWETDNYVFVHGWVPVLDDKLDPAWRDELHISKWNAARWYNGMHMWHNGIVVPGKTVVCGHWHTSWGHAYLHGDGKEWLSKLETFYIDLDTGKQEPHVNNGPFIDEGIIALDACTAVSHKVNCVVLED